MDIGDIPGWISVVIGLAGLIVAIMSYARQLDPDERYDLKDKAISLGFGAGCIIVGVLMNQFTNSSLPGWLLLGFGVLLIIAVAFNIR